MTELITLQISSPYSIPCWQAMFVAVLAKIFACTSNTIAANGYSTKAVVERGWEMISAECFDFIHVQTFIEHRTINETLPSTRALLL